MLLSTESSRKREVNQDTRGKAGGVVVKRANDLPGTYLYWRTCRNRWVVECVDAERSLNFRPGWYGEPDIAGGVGLVWLPCREPWKRFTVSVPSQVPLWPEV